MILVIGAGGTIGSALIEQLRALPHPVRAACHSQRGAATAAARGADVAMIDLADPLTLGPALDGVDSVFLLSATGPEQTKQELNVLAAAQAAATVEQIVKLSVWRADELLTPIARLHWPVEEALEASGMAWTFLRPNFYMQNFARQMAEAIRHEGVIAQPETHAAISFIDARDIARVAAHVLTSDGHAERAYNLTGPEALTYDEAATVFSTVLGKPVRFIGLSDQQAKADMLRRGLSEGYAGTLLEVSRAYRDGGADTVLPTVRELTGRNPGSLEQFITDHAAAFR
jgi:uncharacterized protein YbjT (DUF2867 family)